MGHNRIVGGCFSLQSSAEQGLFQSLNLSVKFTSSLIKSLSRRVCPKAGKAIPPFFRSTKNCYCFSKCFQFCARPLRRPARVHCTQQVWGQPWLVAAEKFCICMCVTLPSVSPSIYLHLPLQHLWPQFGEALVCSGMSHLL